MTAVASVGLRLSSLSLFALHSLSPFPSPATFSPSTCSEVHHHVLPCGVDRAAAAGKPDGRPLLSARPFSSSSSTGAVSAVFALLLSLLLCAVAAIAQAALLIEPACQRPAAAPPVSLRCAAFAWSLRESLLESPLPSSLLSRLTPFFPFPRPLPRRQAQQAALVQRCFLSATSAANQEQVGSLLFRSLLFATLFPLSPFLFVCSSLSLSLPCPNSKERHRG